MHLVFRRTMIFLIEDDVALSDLLLCFLSSSSPLWFHFSENVFSSHSHVAIGLKNQSESRFVCEYEFFVQSNMIEIKVKSQTS